MRRSDEAEISESAFGNHAVTRSENKRREAFKNSILYRALFLALVLIAFGSLFFPPLLRLAHQPSALIALKGSLSELEKSSARVLQETPEPTKTRRMAKVLDDA